jgi:hypothetical protein
MGPEDRKAVYHDAGNTFAPLKAVNTLVPSPGESMSRVVHVPPEVDLETVIDPSIDMVQFIITGDGNAPTAQTRVINSNAMPTFDLPGQEALIGDGRTSLTSGNDREGALVLDNNQIRAVSRDIGDNRVINSSVIERYTDFLERPLSGGIPIPHAHRADAEPGPGQR